MHFIARNQRYPQFSFAVPTLRPLLDKKGRKQDSTIVRFENGVLDTLAQGWTAQEAKVIRDHLGKMKETMVRLTFNSDDNEQGEQVTATTENKPLTVEVRS